MSVLVVGLGNPGKRYELTRHNLGFWVVDKIVSTLGKSWVENKKLQASQVEILCEGIKSIFLKPQTFMNLSGDAVHEYLKWDDSTSISNDLVVIYDDLDFESGVVKFKKGGSAGGHNGLADIINKIGSNDFYRIRVGIGHPRNSKTLDGHNRPSDVKDWVLGKPNHDECVILESAASIAAEATRIFISNPANKRAVLVRDFISKREGQ